MSKRASSLARALVIFLLTLFPPLVIASHWSDIGPSNGGPLGLLSFTLALQSVGLVGYLIALHRPTNLMGWLMLAIGLALPVGAVLTEVIRAMRDPFPVVAGYIAVLRDVVESWTLIGFWLLAILLFPDGRLPGRLWRVLLWPLALGYVAYEASGLLAKAVLSPDVPNPVFVPGMRQDQPGSLSLLLVAVGVLAVLATPLWRWRRALGRERSQLKWIAFAGILALFVIFSPGEPIFRLSLALLLFPAAAGIAILRDRLFDIDFVINRTALYGIVALSLVALFELLSSALERMLGSTLHEQVGLVGPLIAVAVVPAFRPLERRVRPLVDRLLPVNERLALLFTDIVGSTEVLSAVGDMRWRELLGRYYARVRAALRTYGGTEVDTTGDGFFATFRDPIAAAHCALALLPETEDVPLRTRVGLHFGDCDMRGEEPTGINVHVAARVMAAAEGNTVLVSDSCRDALAGAGFVFEPLGPRSLKGIPGQVHLYRITTPLR